MPLPGNISTVTVHGQYLLVTGNPAAGTVTFTQSQFLRNPGANVFIVPPSAVATLNGSGEFTITLIATDDPDLDPSNFTYTVTEFISGSSRSYEIVLPASTPTVELADLAPTSPSSGIAWQYVLVSEKGAANGVATLDGTGKVPTSQLPASTYPTIQDEGTARTVRPTINFVGAGVAATDDSANNRTTVTISGGGATGYQTIQEEGSALTQRSTLNVVGPGVTATDDAANTRTLLTISELVTFNTQTGTSYTAVSGDHTKTIERSNASANTVTIPNNMPTGWWCVIRQTGAGATSVAAGASTILRCRGKTAPIGIAGQWGAVTVTKTAVANEYTVDGDVL